MTQIVKCKGLLIVEISNFYLNDNTGFFKMLIIIANILFKINITFHSKDEFKPDNALSLTWWSID